MKNMNKGIMVSTLAAALAAVTLAGCGNTANEITKTTPVKVPAAVTAVAEDTAKAEDTKNDNEKTEKAKDTKKSKNTKKAKKNKKNSKKAKADKTEPAVAAKAETAAAAPVNQTPAPVVQTAAPAQTVQAPAAQAPVVEAPATVIPQDVYPVWVEGDVYAGTYYEETTGRGIMEVTRYSDNTYSVEVTWPSAANETNYWNFTGTFDGRGNLNYTNCRKTTEAVNSDGSYTYDSCGLMTPYTVYSAGSGSIKFDDYGITWTDNMGDILPGTRFVNYQPKTVVVEEQKTNTKADEIGTAGSNYYQNEGFMTGSFYDGNGSRATLEISKSNVGEGLYDCIVITPDTLANNVAYGFSARLENGMLVYDKGVKSCTTYDINGNIENVSILDEGHFGSLCMTNCGLSWTDSDGSSYMFINNAMMGI